MLSGLGGDRPKFGLVFPQAQRQKPVAHDRPDHETAYGLAALSICESLLTSLRDLKIVGELEVVGILKDAAAAHHQSATADNAADIHRSAATVIDRMIAANSSARLAR